MKYVVFILISIASTNVFGQSPGSFKFQAVLRDNHTQVISQQAVVVRISILQGTVSGSAVYRETHNATTNAYGTVTLDIGKGTVIDGVFDNVNWGAANHFIKVELDHDKNNTFDDMGTTQLLSVPYALYASKSGDEKWTSVGDDIKYTKGRIGIGVDQPSESLHVNGSIRGGLHGGAVRIQTDYGYLDAGAKNADYAHFYTDMPYGFYFGSKVTVVGDLIGYHTDDLHLSTQSGSTYQPQKRVTVSNSTGYVGIGKTNPAYMLDVNGTINASSILINGTPVSGVTQWTTSGSNMYFNTGNVGIGKTNPTYKLDVNGAINASSILVNGSPISGVTQWTNSGSNIYFNTGNVGIGISAPTEKLHINGNIKGNLQGGAVRVQTDYGYIDIGPKNDEYSHFYSNMPYGFYFGSPVTVAGDLIAYKTGDMHFSTQSNFDFMPVKRMSILNSNGNIGIGTTTPQSKLQIESGDIYLKDATSGVIMKSPNGQCWKMTVSNTGTPQFAVVSCPN